MVNDHKLLIRPEGERMLRFALLPHHKPVVLPNPDGTFSVALLAVEYLNSNPAAGTYRKHPETGEMPTPECRVRCILLSQYEFFNLYALLHDMDTPGDFYSSDFTMGTPLPGVTPACVAGMRHGARYKNDPLLAQEVETSGRS